MGITDEGVRLTLRLPERLRNALGRQAVKNHRSLNSEIVSQLNDSSLLKDNYLEESQSTYSVSSEKFDSVCKNLSSREKDILLRLIGLLNEKKYVEPND